jgi:hypothetical protein
MAATIFISIASNMDPLLPRPIAGAPTMAVQPERMHLRIVDRSRQSPRRAGGRPA